MECLDCGREFEPNEDRDPFCQPCLQYLLDGLKDQISGLIALICRKTGKPQGQG